MTTTPFSAPAQPTPPAVETTATQPDTTSGPSSIAPCHEERMAERPDRPWPDLPTTVATQELRLALSFTGGVSLAVWMGGVARELNLITQASELRRTVRDEGQPRPPAGHPSPRLVESYRKLLDLLDVQVCVDVLAGTSAGGINAALLGLTGARWVDLGPLREIWLKAGDFGKLMRDPGEKSPSSLLKGDGQMLTALDEGITQLASGTPLPGHAPPQLDVFITTTYLSPETGRFSDDVGTQIADTDHHGMLHFPKEHLVQEAVPGDDGATRDVKAALALAARSSASFPGAFEPSFVPGRDRAAADARHPDMSLWSNATRSHWAADGGLLANRPIAPLLQTVFDRPADREVRRALLYIVPTSEPPDEAPEDAQDRPLGLADALRKDLGAALNQSIAADLAAIAEHNDRVRATADTGLRMAALANRLRDGRALADDAAWADYRRLQSDWLTTPLVAELTREVYRQADSLPPAWSPKKGLDQDTALRAASRTAVLAAWAAPVPEASGSLATAVGLGRPAYDAARARLLLMLRLGRGLATAVADRTVLARLAMELNQPLSTQPRAQVRELVQQRIRRTVADNTGRPWRIWPSLASVARAVTDDYLARENDPALLRPAWQSLEATYRASAQVLRSLLEEAAPPPDTAPADAGPSLAEQLRQIGLDADRIGMGGDPDGVWAAVMAAVRQLAPMVLGGSDGARQPAVTAPAGSGAAVGGLPTWEQRRAEAARDLRVYLEFFGDEHAPDPIGRFVDLHVGVRSVLPVLTEVAQPVELVQVSADTRSRLAPGHDSAGSKLTGLQLSHFGAFYKPSWRANDWMWGRLDGCGWLVHLLLDPRRILAVLQNAEAEQQPGGTRAARFLTALGGVLGRAVPADVEDLAFLDDDTVPFPRSLPRLSSWAASVLQEDIAAEELPVLAGLVRAGMDGAATSPPERPIDGVPPDPSGPSLMGEKLSGWLAARRLARQRRRVGRLARRRQRLQAVELRVRLRQHEELEELRRTASPATPADRPAGADQGRPTPDARAWLSDFDRRNRAPGGIAAAVGPLLDSCPVPGERLLAEAEARTPLFLRTATQAAAVATAAGTGMGTPPASLRPTFATLRTATRTAYLTASAAEGRRRVMTLTGLGAMVVGFVLMLTGSNVLGIGGLVVFAAGAVILAFAATGGFVAGVSVIVVAALIVVAAAPWLGTVGDTIFTWISKTAIPWFQQNKVVWPVFVLLVLLPPATTIVDLLRRRRRPAPLGAAPPAPPVDLGSLPGPRVPGDDAPSSAGEGAVPDEAPGAAEIPASREASG